MKSIALILPYFGRFPNYFHLFLNSVRHNSSVDVLLFTDNATDHSYPPNVKRVLMSFDEFKSILQKKFDFEITHLQGSYNLCDFRPAYGLCLENYLKDYDFWGHCDCDLVFGDLRRFLTEEILSRYDKILSGGHLTLYRNTETINKRFMERTPGFPFYKEVYTSNPNRVWCYDEWGGVNRLWHAKYEDKHYWPIIYDDVVVKNGFFRVCSNFHDTLNDRFIYRYSKGQMFRVVLTGGGGGRIQIFTPH